MPHRIFEIDEILRDIVWHMKDTGEATTVSFACCCKSFEEPALSLLWVSMLLKELVTLFPSGIRTGATKPTEEEWNRFRRYTSWIRLLLVDLTPGYATPEVFLLLDLIASSPKNGPTQQAIFPNLHGLTWFGKPSSLIHLPSVASPVLTDLRFHTAFQRETVHLPGVYAPLELVINSTLSPPNLRSLCLDTPPESNPSPELKRGVVDLVLRCGSALTTLQLGFELPESVILHLMSLPHLSTWRVEQPAPTGLVSSPFRPTVSFTQLEYLSLCTTTLRGWLSLIAALVGENSHPPPAPHAPGFTFGNLTNLDVNPPSGQQCLHSCIFPLTNSDISLLADTLPRMESIYLGISCFFNTCQTTFRSLHTLSTRCPQLQRVCLHVNTTTLVQDIASVFEEGDQQAETRGTRVDPSVGRRDYPLSLQYVSYLPLEASVGVGDLEAIVKGFFDISMTIDDVTVSNSNSELWAKVSEGIEALRV